MDRRLQESRKSALCNADQLADLIFSVLAIEVSGGCGPNRTDAHQCYIPSHRAYRSDPSRRKNAPLDECMASVVPGGAVARAVESAAMASGEAIVYDRDIEKEFAHALAQETIFAAIEDFLDGFDYRDAAHGDLPTVLQKLRRYINELGTQIMTVPVENLVHLMAEAYSMAEEEQEVDADVYAGPDLVRALQEFVLMRECWVYNEGCQPALEVHFAARQALSSHHTDLDVKLHYGWHPPVIHFHDLQNVTTEGSEYTLKPAISATRPFSALSDIDIEYYVGASGSWLAWDTDRKCFCGRVPRVLAANVGAERHDVYTFPLELTTTIVKHFPDEVRYEIVIRCALPLTIKRKPDECRSPDRTRARDTFSPKSDLLAASKKRERKDSVLGPTQQTSGPSESHVSSIQFPAPPSHHGHLKVLSERCSVTGHTTAARSRTSCRNNPSSSVHSVQTFAATPGDVPIYTLVVADNTSDVPALQRRSAADSDIARTNAAPGSSTARNVSDERSSSDSSRTLASSTDSDIPSWSTEQTRRALGMRLGPRTSSRELRRGRKISTDVRRGWLRPRLFSEPSPAERDRETNCWQAEIQKHGAIGLMIRDRIAASRVGQEAKEAEDVRATNSSNESSGGRAVVPNCPLD